MQLRRKLGLYLFQQEYWATTLLVQAIFLNLPPGGGIEHSRGCFIPFHTLIFKNRSTFCLADHKKLNNPRKP
jgi:hypothetical protein